jgi:regulatory protein YycH of two-component signal transduction system YycFG
MLSQVRYNFATEKNIKRATADDKNRAVSVVSPSPFLVYQNQKNYRVVGKDQFRKMRHDIGQLMLKNRKNT